MNTFDEKFKLALAEYKPASKDVERQKFAEAVAKCVERMERQLANEMAKGEVPAEVLEEISASYRAIFEDTAMKDAVEARIEICGSAPVAVVEAFEELARPLDSSDDDYMRIKAEDLRGCGTSIAEYILGVRRQLRS